jgi:hypothetical protein
MAPELIDTERHVLGGRTFLSVTESTVEHDLYFHGIAGRAGLRFEKHEEESVEAFSARILAETIQSGKALELLGCLLVPEEIGVEGWTPEEARRTAAFIGQLRGEEDKARVRALILSLIIGFFGCGLASVWTSPRSSSGRPTIEPSAGREIPTAATVTGPTS